MKPLSKPIARTIAWGLFLGLYLLLSGSTDVSEIAAGALCATAVLLLVIRLRDRFTTPIHIKGVWLLLLWRIPFAMLQESWQLLVALVRQLSGREVSGHLLEHPYPKGRDHDAARRAYMTFGVCVTPNSYLVFEDRENERALVRQLVGEELSEIDRLFLELP